MKSALKKEIKAIIKDLHLNCTIKDFPNKVPWNHIAVNSVLSEDFITKYQDRVKWDDLSYYQKLSEKCIEKLQDKLDWTEISMGQKLSEKFMEKHQDKLDWTEISMDQKLSEKFIEKHQGKLNWSYISSCQQLSEEFIEKYQDKVYWICISECQALSKEFIIKFKDKINITLYKKSHKVKSLKQKRLEVKQYAEEFNLKYDDEYLYAFREHDQFGSGMHKSNIYYEKGKCYRDWHCDMKEHEQNSFGLGIFAKGNTPVKVKIEDWGLKMNRRDGKCRVWGFEVI